MPGGRRIGGVYTQLFRSLATIQGDMTGNEARALRLGLGLSARALAVEIGTNESSIYRWEWRRDREVPRMFAYALQYLVQKRAGQQRGSNPTDSLPPASRAK